MFHFSTRQEKTLKDILNLLLDMEKSFKDISWLVDEPTYRADPALSYSTLSKYERGGRFKALDTLFDKTESPSLTFGSMVDTLITAGEEEFQSLFTVIDDPGISDSLKTITGELYSRYKDTYSKFDDIPDNILAEVGKECNFYAGDKYAGYRVKLIKESCKPYYNTLVIADGKKVVTSEDVADARRCADVLKTGSTEFYFGGVTPFEEDVEKLYQLKFKHEFGGIWYRCMADLLVVNHKDKTVIPVDLKTSSHKEYEFYLSFTQYRYDIQSRLYWRIIRKIMDEDPYFRDFKLLNYRFIVVNRQSLTPLVWEWPLTQTLGSIDIVTPTGYQYHLRDPETIGVELHHYLEENRRVPYPVQECGLNNILQFIKEQPL